MIKIITNKYYPNIDGGAEISSQTLASGILKKMKVTVLTLGLKDSISNIDGVIVERKYVKFRSEEIIKRDITNINFKPYKNNIVKKNILLLKDYYKNDLYKFYYNYLKAEEISIVHTCNNMRFFDLISCWKASKALNIKIVHTLRDPSLLCFRVDLENKKTFILDWYHRLVMKKLVNLVDVMHSPSNFMIDLHKNYGFKFKNEAVIPNTVACSIPKLEKKAKTIVYVGSIESHKGIKTLIESFKSIKGYKLQLIGNGSYEKEIEKNYPELNIEITGWVGKKELYKLISKSKLLILPSEWDEAFGRVLVEGIYNNTLVIGSNRGAIPEVLNEDLRYIFKEKNVKELRSKINRVVELDEAEYIKELNEMQKYMEKYKLENHINEFEKLYKSLLER